MRVAEVCSTCVKNIDASCIIYNGDYLSTLDLAPLTSLDEVIEKINDNFSASSGEGPPNYIPKAFGEIYIDTALMDVYVGLSTTIPNWGLIGAISTTTTTTTTTVP